MAASAVRVGPRSVYHSPFRRVEGAIRDAKRNGLSRKIWLPFGYSRYDDSDPLEHDARETIYELVEDSPGVYYTRVAEETDIPLSTVRHHCRILVEEGLVEESKLMGKRRLYPVGSAGHELAAALEDDVTATILAAVARLEPATVSVLAVELDRAPSTVSHHLTRLADQDLVVREREGCAVTTRLAPDVRSVFAEEELASGGGSPIEQEAT